MTRTRKLRETHPKLVAIRHAPVEAPGRCYGRADLAPVLSAEAFCDRVQGHVTSKCTIWSSLSSRCARPAELLAARLSSRHQVDSRLHELDFGRWENRLWDEIPRDELDAWGNAWEHEAPPEGETLGELETRVLEWHEALDHSRSHMLIAHAGVVRALWVIRDGLRWPEAMSRAVPHVQPIKL